VTAPESRLGPPAPILERDHDRPAGLDNPRAPRRRSGMPNFEKYTWLFMRFSGVVLIFLALGHLFIGLMWDGGVYRIDFTYVAQRWASPFWQTWDLLLLWLVVPGRNLRRPRAETAVLPERAGPAQWLPAQPAGPYPVVGEVLPEVPVNEEGVLISLRAQDTCEVTVAGTRRLRPRSGRCASPNPGACG